MYTKDQIAELFLPGITEVCQAAGKTETEQRSISRDLVDAAVELPSEEHLLVAEISEGELTRLVEYDAVAAVGLLASLVSGVIGSGSLILVACAVIACLASLRRLRKTASRAEGILFLAVYEGRYHMTTRKQAEKRFRELCELDDDVRYEDFNAALQGLLELDCIAQANGNLRIKKSVIVR